MTPLRHLLLATPLLFLTISSSTVAAADGEKKVGKQAFAYGETVRNDNLWTISREVMPAAGGISQNQVMVATLRHNPDAFFKGNIFHLRKGVLLTIPSLEEIRAEDPGAAAALIVRQEQAWKEGVQDRDTPIVDLPKLKRESAKTDEPLAAAIAPSLKPQAPPVVSLPASTPNNASSSAQEPPAPTLRPAPISVPPSLPTPAPTLPPKPSEAPVSQASSEINYLAYLIGLASLLATLALFFLRRRKEDSPVQQVLKNKAVTQPVVEVGPLAVRETSVAEAEAELKLKMAKAYLELKRDAAAHALLEEIMLEGNDACRAAAAQLIKVGR